MTVSELVPALPPEKAHDWSCPENSNLPTYTTQPGVTRMDAKSRMKLSVQMARIRAKLPPEQRIPLSPAIPVRKSLENAISSTNENNLPNLPSEPSGPVGTPPPPCSACTSSDNRNFVLSLINVDGNLEDDVIYVTVTQKDRKPLKRMCGWESSPNILCKKASNAADNRSLGAAKTSQRRNTYSSNNPAADIKLKINLYDRYTANSAAESFKFFHYTDLRLYIKQYRRNHSCGLGSRSHIANVSPAYENMQRYDYGYERARSYLKTSDGFMLGFNFSQSNPHAWKGNTPISSHHHQRNSKERRQQQSQGMEEPILSPRVFVRQNGAFSHLWKTKEDGTPDPYIAITRPPTTQHTTRPGSKNEINKGNQQIATPNPMKSRRNHDSPGDLSRETPTWRIMQMIASCSQTPSRTDGSSSTTTNECKSRISDIGSSPSQEKSQDTGETSSSSVTPEEPDEAYVVTRENRIADLKRKYGLVSTIQGNNGDKPIAYNNTRSILSNMSNLLSYYIETETQDFEEPKMEDNGNKRLQETAKLLDNDAEHRKQIVLLRKELKNIASRRSPSRQNFNCSSDLAKVGSLVLPGKGFESNSQVRCNTSPQRKQHQAREIRRLSPSPVKSGYSGYKKVIMNAENKEIDDKPMLFVKRSQLLPTVVSSVEAMKSKQAMLHNRGPQPSLCSHPADAKQFTRITDLLKNQIPLGKHPSTASSGRAIHTRSTSSIDPRPIHSCQTRRK